MPARQRPTSMPAEHARLRSEPVHASDIAWPHRCCYTFSVFASHAGRSAWHSLKRHRQLHARLRSHACCNHWSARLPASAMDGLRGCCCSSAEELCSRLLPAVGLNPSGWALLLQVQNAGQPVQPLPIWCAGHCCCLHTVCSRLPYMTTSRGIISTSAASCSADSGCSWG